jgi:hypothetical protein
MQVQKLVVLRKIAFFSLAVVAEESLRMQFYLSCGLA